MELPSLPANSVSCQPSVCSPEMRMYAGAGRRRMPVTRRGTASTPEEASAKASALDGARTPHCKTHPRPMHTGFSQPPTATKRKIITNSFPHKKSVASLTTKPKRKQQAPASENLESPASGKRHKGNPSDKQNCEDSPKEIAAVMALETGCIAPSQPLKQELKGVHVLQSPSRPPLVPRTPATADRTGRIPGMSSCSASITVAPTCTS